MVTFSFWNRLFKQDGKRKKPKRLRIYQEGTPYCPYCHSGNTIVDEQGIGYCWDCIKIMNYFVSCHILMAFLCSQTKKERNFCFSFKYFLPLYS